MRSDEDAPITHLQRRKIEGGILICFIETMKQIIGESLTGRIVDETIRKLAMQDGARWAETYGNSTGSLRRVAEELWAGGGSLEIEVVSQSGEHLDFNVTRCRYAEFYKELGLSDIGYQVHCNRDHTMVAGFNPDIALKRTQTIMEGAGCCDFRYRSKVAAGQH